MNMHVTTELRIKKFVQIRPVFTNIASGNNRELLALQSSNRQNNPIDKFCEKTQKNEKKKKKTGQIKYIRGGGV